VWVDANGDGISQADELKSLADLSITKLNLDAKQDVSLNNGNIVGITSSFETADGATHTAADVWFQMGSTAATSLSSNVSGLSSALSSFEAAASASTTAKLEVPGNVASSAAKLASAIGSYENQLTATSYQAASDESLRLKALQGGAHQGFLAAK
jgi:hypothetical protein